MAYDRAVHQEAVSPLVRDAIALLREQYGDRLLHLAVRAPAPGPEEMDDMDVELIVVLEEPFEWSSEVIAMGPTAGAIGLKYNLACSLMPVTLEQYENPDLLGPVTGGEVAEAVGVF